MTLLNLDNTLNKYLEIINNQVLNPYLLGNKDDLTDTIFYDTSGVLKANVLNTKYDATVDAGDTLIFKIKQVGSTFNAQITNTLQGYLNCIPGNAGNKGYYINAELKAINLNFDGDGLIYYINSANTNKYNDLSIFSSASLTKSGSISNHSYYDYLVRFKVLKYIKKNHIHQKTQSLKNIITTKIRTGGIIEGITESISDISVNKLLNILEFLQIINENNFDKFEVTVDCLYYYYYIALLEYNNLFCERNLQFFSYINCTSNFDLYDTMNKIELFSNPVLTYTTGGETQNYNVKNLLIYTLECLLRANEGTHLGNTFSQFVNNSNSKIHKLLEHLAKLCNYQGKLGIKQSNDGTSTGASEIGTPIVTPGDYLVLNKSHNTSTTVGTKVNFIISDDVTESNTVYNGLIDILECGQLLYNLQNGIDASSSLLSDEKVLLLKELKTISDFLNSLKNANGNVDLISAIKSDINNEIISLTNTGADVSSITATYLAVNKVDGTQLNYIDIINIGLTELQNKLNDILENYYKSKKLNLIQKNIKDRVDSIKSDINSIANKDPNKNIRELQLDIGAYDKEYKKNVDKHKEKNNEIKKLINNNQYSNIFLYITIIILVLICLGVIYINNHKSTLKTQYSIFVIAFLLLYYIIYTNSTINFTEKFDATTDFNKITKEVVNTKISIAEFTDLANSVNIYLLNLLGKSKNYEESLEKERAKYSTFAKTSNSKLNSLNLVLNDEFINAIKSKELVKFLILFTLISIITYIVYVNVDDLITTSIIFIVLLVIILCIYFYNIHLVIRTTYSNKYWNHQMIMKK